jgi:hypothetical protein
MRAPENEADPARRCGQLAVAEAMALKDFPWVPLRFPVQTDLVCTKVQGRTANARDLHPSRWLWLRN